MCKNENAETAKEQLIGALVGLARATEGNVNRPTEETDRAFIKGMRMCSSDRKDSFLQIQNQIEVLHEEKWILIPRCLECASPCGRNNDFEVTGLNGIQNSQLKYVLLSGLLFMASFPAVFDENSTIHRKFMEFLYKAFFFIGYDCEEKSLILLLQELGDWQSKLCFQYSKPESDE